MKAGPRASLLQCARVEGRPSTRRAGSPSQVEPVIIEQELPDAQASAGPAVRSGHIRTWLDGPREEWKNLIEDPRITLDILKYFARDEVGFPANVMVQRELDAAFPQYSLVTLKYHVFCAMKSGLLVVASYDIRDTHERAEINIGHIVGLTSAGSDYVRDSRTKLWDTAMAKLTDAGLEATTGRLVEVLPKIAIQMLQL